MKFLQMFRKFGVFVILVVLIVAFAAINPVFLSGSNIINLSKQIAVMGILSVGMTFGFINGIFIAKIKVPPLIMTLGMQIFLSGLTYTLCNGLPVYGLPGSLKIIAQVYVLRYIPLSALIMLVVLLIGAFVLSKTYFGRYLYAVGSNEEATALSGINTDQIRILAYTLCGVVVGIAGIVMLARLGSGQPAAGTSYEMDVLTACVLGGVSLNGGKGRIEKAFVGILTIGVLSNGMSMAGMGDFQQRMVKGLVLIFAVVLDSMQYVKVRKKVKEIAK